MKDYSSYHNTNYRDKLLRDGAKIFNRSLNASPDAYEIEVNGESKQVMVQSTADYNKRRILFKENDIKWGDIVLLEGEKWLVTERPFFNRIHSKSHIHLCNNVMKFITFTEGKFEYDRLGNKIWIEEPQEVNTLFPAVIESITGTKTATGQQINVPEGDMTLQIQNTDDELIEIGNEFTMFNDTYRIAGIDKSKAHNNQGVLILIVSRVANKK